MANPRVVSLLGLAQSASCAGAILSLGGAPLLASGTLRLAPAWARPLQLISRAEAVEDVRAGAAVARTVLIEVPDVGPLLLVGMLVFALAAVLYAAALLRGPGIDVREPGFHASAGAFSLFTTGLWLLVYRLATRPEVVLPGGTQVAPFVHGPFHLDAAVNPALLFLALCWSASFTFLLTVSWRAVGAPGER